jgi:hypothetical protein
MAPPGDRYSLTDKDTADERMCRQRVDMMQDSIKTALDEYKIQMREGFLRQEKAFDENKRETKEDFIALKNDVDELTRIVSSGNTPLTNRVSVVEERITNTNKILAVIGGATVTSMFGLATALLINAFK